MRLCTFLMLAGLATAAYDAGASEVIDTACREKLTRYVTSLESAFAANQSHFDSQMDALLTKYASSHPAASKASYEAILDQTFEQRFSKLFTHRQVVAGYKGVLDGRADGRNACSMSERKMRKEGERVTAKDKALYDEIAGEMARTFQ